MTTCLARCEERIADAQARLARLEGMIDTTRRVVTAEQFKVETAISSPQIIKATAGNNLALGDAGSWRVIGTINQLVSHTGDLIETELGMIPLPPNSMGPNGAIRVWSMWEGFPTGSGHRHYIYFGQKVIGNRISHWTHSAHNLVRDIPVEVWNAGATDHQEFFNTVNNLTMISHAVPGVSPVETAEDTTVEVPIYFNGKVDNAAHTVTLHHALVEAYYSD